MVTSYYLNLNCIQARILNAQNVSWNGACLRPFLERYYCPFLQQCEIEIRATLVRGYQAPACAVFPCGLKIHCQVIMTVIGNYLYLNFFELQYM